ncbi:MAG: nuclear transport factor 2 family protein [Pseudomonadota bacterium]
MSIEAHKATVRAWFDVLMRNDVDALLNLYHDEMRLWTAGKTLISGWKSKDQIAMFASQILDAFPDGMTYHVHTMVAEGDFVAVEAESDSIHASSNQYKNQYHFLFRFKDEKIIEVKEYMDTELVTDVLCGGERPAV